MINSLLYHFDKLIIHIIVLSQLPYYLYDNILFLQFSFQQYVTHVVYMSCETVVSTNVHVKLS